MKQDTISGWSRVALLFSFLCSLFSPQAEALAFLSVVKPYYALTGSGNGGLSLTPWLSQPQTNQKWAQIFTSTTNTPLYKIITGTSVDCSNKCLDVVRGAWAAVTQIDCRPGNLAQYWIQTTAPAEPTPSNYIWLKNFQTGQCMTAENGNTPNSYVDDYACTDNAPHQLWNIGPSDSNLGGSTITSKAYGTCLQVNGGGPNNGATTSAGSCINGAFYQHFNVTTGAGLIPWGYRNGATGLCLDGGAPSQKACIPSILTQQWLTTTFPDEGTVSYIYLVQLGSGLCLSVNANDPNNVTIISMPCIKGFTNQQWLITQTS